MDRKRIMIRVAGAVFAAAAFVFVGIINLCPTAAGAMGRIPLVKNMVRWTPGHPRQDIPIMVFTVSQREALQQEKFHIGAAPVGPKELAGNSKYVYALPARYNYAFPTGYEEVENILKGSPLHANKVID